MPNESLSLDLLLKLHDSLNELICVLDREGRFVYINKASHRIWGYVPAELIGHSCIDMLVEEDKGPTVDVVTAVHKGADIHTYVNRYYRKDGSIALMFWEGDWNEQDQLMYCTGRDITEQRRLEEVERAYKEELKRTNEHLERITDGFFALDDEARVTYWNQAAETLFNLPRQEVLGKVLWSQMYEPAKSTFMQHYMSAKINNHSDSFELYSERIHSWLEINMYTSGSGLSVYFRDITSKRKLNERLQHERDLQQKRITAAVLKATEEERALVGKELHDNVNQVLTTVKLYNELCLSEEDNNPELLKKSTKLLQEAINEIRGLSKRLSAPSIGGIRLKDSIKELVDAINATKRLSVSYRNDVQELEVADDVHVTVYRILQEQFTNILKHANAKSAKVCITIENQELKVSLSDDGKGFDPAQSRKGIGIENMMSRIQGINGQLCLSSSPGSGCVLELSIPLETQEGTNRFEAKGFHD
jgi:PAS domain S-box-containing protein